MNVDKANLFEKISYNIVSYTELFFYKLGCAVGSNPFRTITLTWLFVILSGLGFLRFHQEKNPINLWVPPHTTFVDDTNWLMDKFQTGFRVQVVLITSEDVLTPRTIQQLLEIHDAVKLAKTTNNITFTDVCFKIPKVDKKLLELYKRTQLNDTQDPSVDMPAALYCSFIESMKKDCLIESILDLWDFNRTIISQLTKNKILNDINNYDKSILLGRLNSFENLLGGIERNQTGHIIRAQAIQNFWMVNVNFSAVNMDEIGNMAGTADWGSVEAFEWESKFLEIIQKYIKNTENITIYYTASRSFGDLSNEATFQDMGTLSIGVVIMAIYVQLVISKYNWLEARVTLGSIGLLTVGMAFVVGSGLCSLMGISYGPIHTSLPFLLMGLGVDDMFVLMACWDDLTIEQKQLPLPIKIGLMLQHGGVSISVTSITDVIAFIIGSSTILPCLKSYCIYAAFGVLMTFIFSITFFTACFTLDQKRIEQKRNGIVPCLVHDVNYKANQCSQQKWSNKIFELIYSNLIFTLPGKVIVVTITIVILGFSIESSLKLEQKFNPEWLIPKNTYLTNFLSIRKLYYPTKGFESGIYMGSINYTNEIMNIKKMSDEVMLNTDIVDDIVSWIDPFHDFVKRNFHTDIYEETLSDDYFNLFLSKFLFDPKNAKYQANFRFENDLECGEPAPKIILSHIDFRFHYFNGPHEHLPAMHTVQNIAKSSNITTGDKFVIAWSKSFASWVIDELIHVEVMRNLQLALLCVMICTILLIANIQICCLIFICVLLTMIGVCGLMQRWNLTIDLVSCIGLELAIGLCVDYAAHVGHTFLTIQIGNRTERSLKTVSTIGAAVLYGGLSTIIGVSMLGLSECYTFQAFFKIFFLVVILGLYHGVVFLPVVLTWFGPKPYKNHQILIQNPELELN